MSARRIGRPIGFTSASGSSATANSMRGSPSVGRRSPVPTKDGIPPCRLSVILARTAPVGVIFRRGPRNLIEIIKWHTDTDTFERGQWFKGRIDEECADLAPDGSLLIYRAEKSHIGS